MPRAAKTQRRFMPEMFWRRSGRFSRHRLYRVLRVRLIHVDCLRTGNLVALVTWFMKIDGVDIEIFRPQKTDPEAHIMIQNTLFEEPAELYELFDANQQRVLFTLPMKPDELGKVNKHYRDCRCPHLQYRPAGARSSQNRESNPDRRL